MTDGKCVVVVTGGSGGIGRSICQSFANSKTHLFFTYYSNKNAAQKTVESVANTGCKVSYSQLDVSSSKDVKDFLSFVFETSKQIDVLINNAGMAKDELLLRMKEESWDQVINTNLKGTFNCIKSASRMMLTKRYGRIINITSVVGITGNEGQGNYAAAKAGIIALTKTAARELASRNITVNAVAPGYVNTAMTKNTISTDHIKKIPLGRIGQPNDISAVVRFLASENASYITGQVINVNGGIYM